MSVAADQVRERWRPRGPWSGYVAVGGSLSEGLGDPLPDGSLGGWAALLAEHLQRISPQLQFKNLAVRGYRTREAIRYELDAALALKPDLVTVFIGGTTCCSTRASTIAGSPMSLSVSSAR